MPCFFPFVSPPICVRGYHRNVFLSLLLAGGGERGGYYLEVQPEAHSAHLGHLSILPKNDRLVCAL